MSFDLRIIVTGLCLFVPARSNKKMHVLMPSSGGSHRHFPRLFYNTTNTEEGFGKPDSWLFLDMDGYALDLTALASGSAEGKLWHSMVPLDPVTGKKIKNKQLGMNPEAAVASRLTLAAGKIEKVAQGAIWDWGPDDIVELTHQVTWTIQNLSGDRLEPGEKWRLEKLRAAGTCDLPLLKSVGGKPIEIYVFHSVEGDEPGGEPNMEEPDEGFEPLHFDMFYDLFPQSVTRRLPRYRPVPDVRERWREELVRKRGGSPFTCMVAASLPGD